MAVILGIIQGITEWLPVSSSGHLALMQHFFGVHPPLIFDMLLHLGTLAAVVAYFRNDLISLASDILLLDTKSEGFRIGLLIILASVPTALIGLTMEDYFAGMFTDIPLVGLALIITGIVLFLTRNKSGEKNISIVPALVMGLFQGFAVAPGISRSGMTISAGILLGIDRKKAARFSFLLFIPAILGAIMLKSSDALNIGNELIGPAIVGTLVSAAVGYLAIGALLNLIKKQRFSDFSYYCIVLGIIAIATSL